MSAIVWDKVGEHYYETGTDRGVLYPANAAGNYQKGVAWNGLTAVTESPSGAEASPLYADNIKYLNLISAEEFGATIEAYTYPDEFAPCNGEAELATGVKIGQQNRRKFCFAYRTLLGNDTVGTDLGYLLHIVYNCSATPSEKSYQTVNDSPEAITFSWEISTTPVNVTGAKPTANITIDSTKVDAAKLKQLEEKLYGTDSAEPQVVMPDEIAAIFAGDNNGITFDVSTLSLTTTGDTGTITATTVPAGQTVTWESNDTSVATVSGGVVTPVAAGTATVTGKITVDGVEYSATCAVTVAAG